MLADLDSTRFCTVVYARICPGRDGGALVTLACGGHPPPLVVRATGEVEAVGSAGTLVGGVADPRFTDVDVRLGPGDAICLYTDGVTELRTSDPDYGERRLRETLHEAAGGTAEEIALAVETVAVEAQGGRPRDDIALLTIRIRPET
jgi:phosphoserine phosphatase RsbU/P